LLPPRGTGHSSRGCTPGSWSGRRRHLACCKHSRKQSIPTAILPRVHDLDTRSVPCTYYPQSTPTAILPRVHDLDTRSVPCTYHPLQHNTHLNTQANHALAGGHACTRRWAGGLHAPHLGPIADQRCVGRSGVLVRGCNEARQRLARLWNLKVHAVAWATSLVLAVLHVGRRGGPAGQIEGCAHGCVCVSMCVHACVCACVHVHACVRMCVCSFFCACVSTGVF